MGCCCGGSLWRQVERGFLLQEPELQQQNSDSSVHGAEIQLRIQYAAPQLHNAYLVQMVLSMLSIHTDKVLKLSPLKDNRMHAKFTCI